MTGLKHRIGRLEDRSREPEVRRTVIVALPERPLTEEQEQNWIASERQQHGLGPDDTLIILTSPSEQNTGNDTEQYRLSQADIAWPKAL